MTAGDQSLETAQRETQEELGIDVPIEVGYKNLLSLLLSHAELLASVCSLGTSPVHCCLWIGPVTMIAVLYLDKVAIFMLL